MSEYSKPASPSGSVPVLPWHSQPKDDDIFSFWFLRLATGHGLSAERFSKRIGIKSIAYLDAWRGSVDNARQCAIIVSEQTSLPLEALYRTVICELAGIVPEDWHNSPFQYEDLWITRRVLGKSCPFHGDFCPMCLKDCSPFKLSWRICLVVACPVHGCLLSNACGSCGKPFMGVGHLRTIDLSGRFEMVTQCPSCSTNLSLGICITPASRELTQLETIHRKLISKRSCSGYFATWRYLLESFLIESSSLHTRTMHGRTKRWSKFLPNLPQNFTRFDF